MSDDVVDIAKEETVRQTVILGFSLVGTVIMVYLMRKANDPDVFRTAKMASALRLKRIAQRQAVWWEDLAEKAATVYQKERW